MPDLYYDINVNDFYNECSSEDKRELVDLITSDVDIDFSDYVISPIVMDSEYDPYGTISTGNESFDQVRFKKSLYALDKNYHCLPNELIEQINKLAEKFNF